SVLETPKSVTPPPPVPKAPETLATKPATPRTIPFTPQVTSEDTDPRAPKESESFSLGSMEAKRAVEITRPSAAPAEDSAPSLPKPALEDDTNGIAESDAPMLPPVKNELPDEPVELDDGRASFHK